MGIKSFLNNYTPAGALYKAATGNDLTDDAGKAATALYDASLPKLITTGSNTITDAAGEAWSKAVDDTGISKTVGDAATALYDASLPKLITTGSNTITDAAGEAWSNISGAAGTATDTITNTVTTVKETVKDTVQNVTKGISDALPIIGIGVAALVGLALLFGRR